MSQSRAPQSRLSARVPCEEFVYYYCCYYYYYYYCYVIILLLLLLLYNNEHNNANTNTDTNDLITTRAVRGCAPHQPARVPKAAAAVPGPISFSVCSPLSSSLYVFLCLFFLSVFLCLRSNPILSNDMIVMMLSTSNHDLESVSAIGSHIYIYIYTYIHICMYTQTQHIYIYIYIYNYV